MVRFVGRNIYSTLPHFFPAWIAFPKEILCQSKFCQRLLSQCFLKNFMVEYIGRTIHFVLLCCIRINAFSAKTVLLVKFYWRPLLSKCSSRNLIVEFIDANIYTVLSHCIRLKSHGSNLWYKKYSLRNSSYIFHEPQLSDMIDSFGKKVHKLSKIQCTLYFIT
jgi:hypothetical protein